ncbi:MAG: polysaccharide biosynthesis C-terminal domain-containing protein, partial [Lachnospiraceae bacterium]|nr:polysaccharide biosynthesis C-terminal domain-containing protein [Lachnospiraceae bacterium]
EEEYLPGYIVAPYLFIAPLLLMLFQVITNQFLVIKKTWPNMLILIVGAASNVLFNYILIPKMGIEGAAIGTLIGYIVSLVIACLVLLRMKLLVIKGRFYAAVLVMAGVMLGWRLFLSRAILPALALAVAGSLIIMVLYLSDIKGIISAVKRRINKGNEV